VHYIDDWRIDNGGGRGTFDEDDVGGLYDPEVIDGDGEEGPFGDNPYLRDPDEMDHEADEIYDREDGEDELDDEDEFDEEIEDYDVDEDERGDLPTLRRDDFDRLDSSTKAPLLSSRLMTR
jgi:hypothetical protein